MSAHLQKNFNPNKHMGPSPSNDTPLIYAVTEVRHTNDNYIFDQINCFLMCPAAKVIPMFLIQVKSEHNHKIDEIK